MTRDICGIFEIEINKYCVLHPQFVFIRTSKFNWNQSM